MWYEILPSAAIVFVGIAFPGYGLYYVHNLVLGNHFRRSMSERWDRVTYERDRRLTGDSYKISGLEAIPDE